MTLPDATRAPQFQYATQEQIDTVRSKIIGMNAFIREQARYYQMQGIRIVLFDAYTCLTVSLLSQSNMDLPTRTPLA